MRIIVILVVAVLVVLGLSWTVTRYLDNRPDPEPETVAIEATVGDTTVEVFPYAKVEPGLDPEVKAVTQLAVGPDEELELSLPEPIYDHDWSLLSIYDDPAYNKEDYFTGRQQRSVIIPGIAPDAPDETAPRLVVVEVKSVLIGHDAHGEETPYYVTWSINAQP